MASIRNVPVGVRLASGYAIVLAFMMATTAFGISALRHANDATRQIVQTRYVLIEQANGAIINVELIARSFRNMLLETDDEVVISEMASVDKATKEAAQSLADMQKIIDSDKGRELLTLALTARSKAVADETEFMALVGAGKREEATTFLLRTVRASQAAGLETLSTLVNFSKGYMALTSAEVQASYSRVKALLFALATMAGLLGCAIAWWLTRSIAAPLRNAVRIADRVAKGDLTCDIEATTRDETGALLKALRDMVASLRTIVLQVQSGTAAISTEATQIAAGNANLAQRTEQQAASLEETAASMEQLTGTVRQNAENAKQANELAVDASRVAVKGGEVMGRVVDTMSAIDKSSKQIADIIGVIDGIAFQTNILALNAAVEAARAGEQGRGFAVVANEVRSLAQRSAAAAKEIKGLIVDSVANVGHGTRLVGEAGKTMGAMVPSAQRVAEIMTQIAAASDEQSSGIDQVKGAVSQMDGATQQNASLVQDAARAAQSLEQHARNLAHAVAVFKIADAQADSHGGRQLTRRREPPSERLLEAPGEPATDADSLVLRRATNW